MLSFSEFALGSRADRFARGTEPVEPVAAPDCHVLEQAVLAALHHILGHPSERAVVIGEPVNLGTQPKLDGQAMQVPVAAQKKHLEPLEITCT